MQGLCLYLFYNDLNRSGKGISVSVTGYLCIAAKRLKQAMIDVTLRNFNFIIYIYPLVFKMSGILQISNPLYS